MFDKNGYDSAVAHATLTGGAAPNRSDFISTVFDEAAYNTALADHTAAMTALGADFKIKKENDAREKYIVGAQDGTISDDSIKNAIHIISNTDSSLAQHSSDGYFHYSGDVVGDSSYIGIDNIDKAKKGENSNLQREKNDNDRLMDADQTILSQIEQAEAEHKRAKEEYEASEANVRRQANKKSEEARRGQGNNNGGH